MTSIYTQTNETENKIIRFRQGADGKLVEVQRIATGGRGTDGNSAFAGEGLQPDSLTSSNAVIASKDKQYLFAVNAGDNTVSAFAVDADGMLTLTDCQRTGVEPAGKFGTASSLAYNNTDKTLYVSHTFGPDHIRAFSVMAGKLVLRPDAKSVNLPGITDRIPTQIVMSPDDRFLIASVLLDARPSAAGLVPAAEKNLVVFPVMKGGVLGEPKFNRTGGATPFASAFLNGSTNSFVTVLAAESAAVVSTIAPDGSIMSGIPAKIDTTMNGRTAEPSEICWVSLSEDNKYAFGANFGFGTVSVFSIDGGKLRVKKSEAAKEIGDGMFKGLAGVPTSGAGDNAVAGKFLYQLYANASKLVGYRIEDDGALTKITEVPVPHNSAQGLAKV